LPNVDADPWRSPSMPLDHVLHASDGVSNAALLSRNGTMGITEFSLGSRRDLIRSLLAASVQSRRDFFRVTALDRDMLGRDVETLDPWRLLLKQGTRRKPGGNKMKEMQLLPGKPRIIGSSKEKMYSPLSPWSSSYPDTPVEPEPDDNDPLGIQRFSLSTLSREVNPPWYFPLGGYLENENAPNLANQHQLAKNFFDSAANFRIHFCDTDAHVCQPVDTDVAFVEDEEGTLLEKKMLDALMARGAVRNQVRREISEWYRSSFLPAIYYNGEYILELARKRIEIGCGIQMERYEMSKKLENPSMYEQNVTAVQETIVINKTAHAIAGCLTAAGDWAKADSRASSTKWVSWLRSWEREEGRKPSQGCAQASGHGFVFNVANFPLRQKKDINKVTLRINFDETKWLLAQSQRLGITPFQDRIWLQIGEALHLQVFGSRIVLGNTI